MDLFIRKISLETLISNTYLQSTFMKTNQGPNLNRFHRHNFFLEFLYHEQTVNIAGVLVFGVTTTVVSNYIN